MKLAALIMATAFSSPCQSQSVELPIDLFFESRNLTGIISIGSLASVYGRCEFPVAATLPELWTELDRIGTAKGNMGSSRNRLYWIGPSSLIRVNADGSLSLRSRAHYELWAYIEVLFDTLKTQILEVTEQVDIRASIRWDNVEDRLQISYEITNIHNFPGDIEQYLRQLGVDFGDTLTFRLPDNATMGDLDSRLSSGPDFQSTDDGRGLIVTAVVSATLPVVSFGPFPIFDTCTALGSVIQSDPETARTYIADIIRQL